MIVTKEKRTAATPEQRAIAVEMVVNGATLREAAAVTGYSHQSISTWVKAAELAAVAFKPASAQRKKKRRGPVYVDGQRLGRLALWT